MANLYKNKIYSVFGVELGNKILALVDPCYQGDADCDRFKACETLTDISLNGDGNIVYKDEDGNSTLIPLVDIKVSDLEFNADTYDLTVVRSDGENYTINLASLLVQVADTNSVDLSLTDNIITANVILDPDTSNTLESRPNGLFSAPETITNLAASLDISNPSSPLLVLTYTNENNTQSPLSINLSSLLDDTDTTYTLTNNSAVSPGTIVLTGSDGTLNVVDICQLIETNCPETVTSITYDTVTNTITFVDEDGTSVPLDLNEVLVTNTVVGNRIATITNEVGVSEDINETITTLVDNGDNSFTFTSEDGTVTTFTQTSDSLVDNGDGTFTHTDVDGNIVTVDFNNSTVTSSNTGKVIASHNNGNGVVTNIEETITEITASLTGTDLIITYVNENSSNPVQTVDLSSFVTIDTNTTYTLIDNSDGTISLNGSDSSINTLDICQLILDNCPPTLTSLAYNSTLNQLEYTDENGAVNNILLNVVTVTNTVAGNLIANVTNEVGTVFSINETITGLAYTPATQTLTYTKEDGTLDTINLSTLAVDINVASVTYDALTNVITVTETDGTLHNVDLTDLVDTYTLIDNGDGTATLEDTAGNSAGDINICQMIADGGCTDSLVNNGNGTYTHTALDGTAIVIDTNDVLTSISFDAATNEITYVNENGVSTVLLLSSGNTSAITNTVAGNRIATHDDGTGNLVDINESDTPITANADGTYSYTSELGTTTVITDAFHQYVNATGGNKPATTPTTPIGYVGTPKINSTAEVTYDDCVVHYSYNGTTWSIEKEDCGSSVEAFNGTQVDTTTGRIELGDDAIDTSGAAPATHISNRFQNIRTFNHRWVGTDDEDLFGILGDRAISNPDASNNAGNDVVVVGLSNNNFFYKFNVGGRILANQGSNSPVLAGNNNVGATANAVLTRTPVHGANNVATSVTSIDSVIHGANGVFSGGVSTLTNSAYIAATRGANNGTNSFLNSFVGGGRDVFNSDTVVNSSVAIGGNGSIKRFVDVASSVAIGGSNAITTLPFPINGQVSPEVINLRETVAIAANNSMVNVTANRSILFGAGQGIYNVDNINTSIVAGASGAIQNVDFIIGSVVLAGESSVQGNSANVNGQDRIDGSVVLFGKTSGTDSFYYRNSVVLGSTSVGNASEIQQGAVISYAGGNNTKLFNTYHIGGGVSYSDITGTIVASSQSSASHSIITASALMGGVDGRNNGVGHGSEFTNSTIAGTNAGDYASDSDSITAVGFKAYEYGTGNNLSFFGSRANIEWVGSGNTFTWVAGDWTVVDQIGTLSNASITAFIAAEGLAVGDRVTVKLGAGSLIQRANGTLNVGAGVSFTVVDVNTLEFNGLLSNTGAGNAESNANAGITNSNAIGVDALVSRSNETKLGGTGTLHYRAEPLRVFPDTAAAMADVTLLSGDFFRVNDVNGAGQVFQK